jgi:S1-C subfamily serine protease
MFAFSAAKRPLGVAALLVPCLVAMVLTGSAAAAGQGYLGIMLQDLTPSMAKALQLGDGTGVIINSVTDDSPAAKAGVVDGDVIIELNGAKVTDTAGFTSSVRALAPGDKAVLVVQRDGKKKTLTAELGERPTDLAVGANPRGEIRIITPDGEKVQKFEGLEGLEKLKELQGIEGLEELKNLDHMKMMHDGNMKVIVIPKDGEAPEGFAWENNDEGDGQHRIIVKTMRDDDRGWLGVHLDSLNEQLGSYFGVKDGAGVLVTEVVDDSPAAKAGLLAGDVIVKAGDADTASPDALHEAMGDTKPGDAMSLTVLRKGARKTITAKLGEMPADAVGAREFRIEGGEPGEMKLMMPRMLRHLGQSDMGQSDEGDGNVERRIIIRKHAGGGDEDANADLSEVREEIDALRQEMKELREQLKR